MMQDDLTLSQVLTDPLIRQLMRADGVTFADFAALLENAAAGRPSKIHDRVPGFASSGVRNFSAPAWIQPG